MYSDTFQFWHFPVSQYTYFTSKDGLFGSQIDIVLSDVKRKNKKNETGKTDAGVYFKHLKS